jgi:hypothetical protein
VWLTWSPLTTALNGGDLPIFYEIEYSPENVTWYSINANGSLKYQIQYAPATILTKISFFRAKAKNNVGMSNFYSPVLKVTASNYYSPQACAI